MVGLRKQRYNKTRALKW